MIHAGKTICVTVASTLLIAGCNSSRAILIRTDEPAELAQINPTQGLAREFGKAPVRVTSPEGSYVLRIQNKMKDRTVIMVLPESEKLSGILDVKVKSRSDADVAVLDKDIIFGYGHEIDLLAKAHRMILRGEKQEARVLLDELAKTATIGTPGLYLRGLNALFDGNTGDFSHYFELALEQDDSK